jgi:hypothetical protein
MAEIVTIPTTHMHIHLIFDMQVITVSSFSKSFALLCQAKIELQF